MKPSRTLPLILAGSLAMVTAFGSAAAETTPSTASPVAEQMPARVAATFTAWDVDKDKVLSLQEFEAGWRNLQRASALEMSLHRQFNLVDANKSGAIDPGEYNSLLLVKRAGKSAPQLSSFDANRNQRLEFGEYLVLVRRMTSVPQPGIVPAQK